MNCETFWQTVEAEALLGHPLPTALEEHLTRCPACSEALDRMKEELAALKSELHREEPAAFWHGMRKEVSQAVRPPIRFPAFCFPAGMTFPRWCVLPLAGVLLLVLLLLRPGNTPLVLSEEEIPLLVGVVPTTMVLEGEEWGLELSDTADSGEETMSSLGGWDALLIDLDDEAKI